MCVWVPLVTAFKKKLKKSHSVGMQEAVHVREAISITFVNRGGRSVHICLLTYKKKAKTQKQKARTPTEKY